MLAVIGEVVPDHRRAGFVADVRGNQRLRGHLREQEGRIAHLQRLEQVAAAVVLEELARYLVDEIGQDVVAEVAVNELVAAGSWFSIMPVLKLRT